VPWNDLLVDPKRASLALSVVQGLSNDDPNAERMALEAFDSLEDAAMSYAYLVGFLIEDVAAARRLSVSAAIAELRTRLLGSCHQPLRTRVRRGSWRQIADSVGAGVDLA
jgi:hypothetical protein